MSCIVFVNIQSAGKIPNNNYVHEKKKQEKVFGNRKMLV
jgi:hypothetical protein